MKDKIYHERRLYFGDECNGCGIKYQSFKKSKIQTGLCANCRRAAAKVDENQESLFSEEMDNHLREASVVRSLIKKADNTTLKVKKFVSIRVK